MSDRPPPRRSMYRPSLSCNEDIERWSDKRYWDKGIGAQIGVGSPAVLRQVKEEREKKRQLKESREKMEGSDETSDDDDEYEKDEIPGKWVVIRKIGVGNNSNAWLAKDNLSGQVVAIKIPARAGYTEPSTEKDVLLKLSHRYSQPALVKPGLTNLIRLYECTPVQPGWGAEALVLEPLSISMEGLVELLKKEGTQIPIDFARKTARGLTEGVRYMHEEMSLIYLGCKPANVLFRVPDMQRHVQEEMEAAPSPKPYQAIKIQPIGMGLWDDPNRQREFFEHATVVMTDFGRSQWEHKKEGYPVLNRRMCPPEYWVQLELTRGKPLDMHWGRPVDIWTIGTTMAFMLLGDDMLCSRGGRRQALRDIAAEICGYSHKFVKDFPKVRDILDRKGKFRGYPMPGDEVGAGLIWSLKRRGTAGDFDGTYAFLRKCLTIRPKMRPTANELLKHPWLNLDGPSNKKAEDDMDLDSGCEVSESSDSSCEHDSDGSLVDNAMSASSSGADTPLDSEQMVIDQVDQDMEVSTSDVSCPGSAS